MKARLLRNLTLRRVLVTLVLLSGLANDDQSRFSQPRASDQSSTRLGRAQNLRLGRIQILSGLRLNQTEGLPPGQVAVEFLTPQAASPVNPGNFIDVIATVNTELFVSKNPQTVSRTVFQALRVIRVDRPAPRGHVGILTVAMSPCDAHYSPWFVANAELRFTSVTPVPYDFGSIHTETCGTGDVSPAAVDARWHFSSSS